MAMEIEDEECSKLILEEKGHKAVFGRGNGFTTDDLSVSRCHVLFEFEHKSANQEVPTVSFEVLGKNPIWIRSQKDRKIRVFRRSEKGEVAAGDWFCVSGKRPSWFRVREIGVEVEEKRVFENPIDLAEGLQSGSSKLEGLDVSGIDPYQEFGFAVMGHEFDHYPKQMICDMKKWNWFLEEPRKESDNDDEFDNKERKAAGTKRKKSEENEDDEWTGESEVDEELVAKLRKVNTPKYSTRSKARSKLQKDKKGGSKRSEQKKTSKGMGDEDEDDETLGGFIVGEEEDLEENEGLEETDEDEEFLEDDDDNEEVDD